MLKTKLKSCTAFRRKTKLNEPSRYFDVNKHIGVTCRDVTGMFPRLSSLNDPILRRCMCLYKRQSINSCLYDTPLCVDIHFNDTSISFQWHLKPKHLSSALIGRTVSKCPPFAWFYWLVVPMLFSDWPKHLLFPLHVQHTVAFCEDLRWSAIKNTTSGLYICHFVKH